MTCKDCMGYKFCSRGRDGQTNFYGVESACNNVETLCNDFKNKSDYTEVVHGRWIDCIETGTTVAGINVSGLTGYNCSVCGRYEGIKELYCNCGAKMDGVQGR